MSFFGMFFGTESFAAEIQQLQEVRAQLDADLAFQNESMKAADAVGDKEAAKAAHKAYMATSKARDQIYRLLKLRNKGVLPPPLPPKAAPRPAPAPKAVVYDLTPGQCYDGPVPKGHFKRGEQIGSEEPFSVKGRNIVRSPVCESGWVIEDPTARARVAPAAQAQPLVRRRSFSGLW